MSSIDDARASYSTLAHVLPRLDRARAKLHGQLPGYKRRAAGATPSPGSALETCSCGPNDDCDHNVSLTGPEETMAAAEAGQIDGARADLARVDHITKTVRRLIAELDDIVTRQVPLEDHWRAPDPKKPPQNRDGDGKLIWCQHCWTDHGHLEATHEDYAELCRWCGRFLAKNKRLPNLGELHAHHTGRIVRVKDAVTIRPRGRKVRPTPAELKAGIVDRQNKRLARGERPC